ncbi:TPA: MFS transporter [Pseudomonas aeruginosa]|nr:MFS transporter [Pseudomonas aeruginosa]
MGLSNAKPANPALFGVTIATGLVGVLLASLTAGLNEHVTDVAMVDIRGVLSIGYDEGTWLTTLYEAMLVAGMAFSPWFSVTFSLRRFTLFAISGFAVVGLLCPFAPNLEALYVLRALQGLLGGCLPPMLMTAALRFLPPDIKLYGLGAYALTATFGPNLGVPLAAFWTEYFGWQWVFWQVIPLCALSFAFVSFGLPQDPLRLERFKQFDIIGFLVGVPAICFIVIGLLQGDRLDWFNSNAICFFLGVGGLLFAFFLLNEWTHSLPFFRLDILKRRNFTHSLITLTGVLVVLGASMGVPVEYLAKVHGYRPLESAPMIILVALPQLLSLPLVAGLCNIPRVDCRWILAIGLALCAISCIGMSHLTSEWTRENFYLLLSLQIIGQPMAVVPLLMSATSVVAPVEGPFASAWFNTTRGFASVISTSLIGVLTTAREHYHSSRLMDHLGNSPELLELRFEQIRGKVPDASHNSLLEFLSHQVHEQVIVLGVADIFFVMAIIALLLIILIPILPLRVYPPRAVN